MQLWQSSFVLFTLAASLFLAAPVPAEAAPAAPAKASPAPPSGEKPYADVGEEVLPADKAPKDAPLRAREADTFLKLSNPRIERGPRPWPVLAVDYDRTHDGHYNGLTLVVHPAKGPDRRYLLIGPFAQKTGSIRIDLHIGGPLDPGPPKDAELYLTRQDMRYGKWVPTFKVSNSVVLGTVPSETRPREWTAEEADRLSKPPPDFANANAHPGVGQDTAFAGNATGAVSSRFVSPDHPLLGVEYRTGEWAGEKCLGQLVPVFAADQPVRMEPRVIAKDGYAVGGMNVKAGKYVDAVQLIFMKSKPDGSLDPKDSYTSDWLGPASDAKPQELGGDGRRVIGIHCRQGAILDGLALVMDKEQKAGKALSK